MRNDTGWVTHSEPLTRAQVESLPFFCCVVSPLVVAFAVLVACIDYRWRS